MPSILIVPETGSDDVPERFKLRERISVDDLDDDHICAQLLERIGWAVEDAEREEERRRGSGRDHGELARLGRAARRSRARRARGPRSTTAAKTKMHEVP